MLVKSEDQRITYDGVLKITASMKSTPINDRDLAVKIQKKTPENLASNEEKLEYYLSLKEIYEKFGHYSEAIRNMELALKY